MKPVFFFLLHIVLNLPVVNGRIAGLFSNHCNSRRRKESVRFEFCSDVIQMKIEELTIVKYLFVVLRKSNETKQ